MEFLLEENALLRDTLKRIVQKMRDAGMIEALNIIEQESGVTTDEILQPKCN